MTKQEPQMPLREQFELILMNGDIEASDWGTKTLDALIKATDAHDQQVRKEFAEECKQNRPKIVCLCGSVRFSEAFIKANTWETLEGNIVLSIGCNMKSDTETFGSISKEELESIKVNLDNLHKRKIDLADEILVMNMEGYIGDSTRSEIEYAKVHNKIIRYLEDEYCEEHTHECIGQYQIFCPDCITAHIRAKAEGGR